MYPELIPYPHVDSYPALLFLGFLAGHLLARHRARQNGVETRHLDNLTLLLVVFGLVGARFFSWLFDQKPGASLLQNLKLWGPGGLVFYGGAIFGVLCVWIYSRLQRLSALKMADIYAPSLALGLGFGRIGCFLAGCCWGDVCAAPAQLASLSAPAARQVFTLPPLSPPGFFLAASYPRGAGAYEQHLRLGLLTPEATRSLPVHPSQLYEAALAFALCWILHRTWKSASFRGEVLARFGIGYGIIRFLLEFLRADNSPRFFGLTLSQMISLLFIAAGSFAILRSRAPTGLVSAIAASPVKPQGAPDGLPS